MNAIRGDIFKKSALVGLLALLGFVWFVLGSVYLDRFIEPLHGLELKLMPWKAPLPAKADLDLRLSIMQQQLDESNRVAKSAFLVMVISFSALLVYLSVLFQQRRRRARENMFLTLKNQEIARRNEFIRYISATIGHEFKNNLGRIKRRMDLLPGVPVDFRERIDENLDKLFADINIFKKISDEREAGLVEFKHMDLLAVLSDLARQYGDFADIEIERSVSLPMIYAAPPLVKTVFENLFDNAVKYKKPDQAKAQVRVSNALEDDEGRWYVVLSVRDDGIGMDEQQADKCFYLGKGSGESWGQGLYFVKYVIGLHAGKIRIGKDYTAAGKGTEIIIKLPFVQEAVDV